MDKLKLENQLCFPLYAASKEVVKQYMPILHKIGLTYTQYLVMMVMWEKKQIGAKALGEILFLDSGTITPVVKKLEQVGFVKRQHSKEDERTIEILLTKSGEKLKEQAEEVPEQIAQCINLDIEEAKVLYTLLYKILNESKEKK